MSTLDVDITQPASKLKRAPRKRVSTKEGDAVAKPRVRATRVRAKVSAIQVDTTEATSVRPLRKAPPRLEVSVSQSTSRRSKTPYIVAACFCVVLGVAAGIGVSDAGQIDVQAKINAQAQSNNTTVSEDGTVTVPVADGANQAPIAIGSLRGRGVGTEAAEPVIDTASSSLETTATSSPDGTASSSVDGTEEESEDVPTDTLQAEPPVIEETPVEATQ